MFMLSRKRKTQGGQDKRFRLEFFVVERGRTLLKAWEQTSQNPVRNPSPLCECYASLISNRTIDVTKGDFGWP